MTSLARRCPRQIFAALAVAAITAAADPAAGAPTFVGPLPYLRQADSPFDLTGLGVTAFLEDCEDGAVNTPGVSTAASVTGPGGFTDSVDGDDGMVDGSGSNGRSLFSSPGSAGITFTFDPGLPAGLPTRAGVVWTDGAGSVTFDAFGPGGTGLGAIGPVDIADGSILGTTDEDRFFGVEDAAGISAIRLSNVSGGIEVDHLQYRYGPLGGATTTTTTIPAAGCVVEPTFASLNCRLAALLERVRAATDLGGVQPSLVKAAEKALERKEQAEEATTPRRAKSLLKKAIRKLVAFRQNASRRSIPRATRDVLRADALGILNDLKTLRGSL